MTVVWLSPGLPADRAELAAALPADFVLADHSLADPALSVDHEAQVHGLAVGSLCVATVFETDLIARLESRPEGVQLLVIGPPDHSTPPLAFGGRAPELVTSASSVGELATVIQQLVNSTATAPLAATKVTSLRRGRLVTAGAVLGALAIGGIVIASTEGSSAATANGGRGGFGAGGNFGGFGGGTGGTGTIPGGGNFGGAPGGTGAQGSTGAVPGAQELLACLRKQGFTGTAAQLLQSRSDPKLQQAFLTCVQQLRAGGTTSSKITGRP